MNSASGEELKRIAVELQEAVRSNQPARPDPQRTPGFDPIANVRSKQIVNPHLPIGWPTMPRGLVPRAIAYAQKVTRRLLRWYINPIVAQQNELNAAMTDLLQTFLWRLEENAQATQATQATLASLAGQRSAERMQQETVNLRLQRLESARREAVSKDVQSPSSAIATPIDYFLLGAMYRNRQQMARWLGDYDDLFGRAVSTHGVLPVLDIGCGRGDFVEHLVALGITAYGIDIDAEALSIGQERGLDLRLADALEHLQTLPDDSLAAVTLIQIVEHLGPEQFFSLLQLVARKLAPGGFVVAETINPTCIYAMLNWYLMDPSHRSPVHHETNRFLMAQAGFHPIEIRFLHPVPEQLRLERISLAGDTVSAQLSSLVAQVQRQTEQLNDFMYGPQDYAAIAYKPAQP